MTAPWGPSCRDVTRNLKQTNNSTCRDCFNLKTNFHLEKYKHNCESKMYMTFSNNVLVEKIASPVESIVSVGEMDNGDFKFNVSFDGQVFGDGRINFNAGLNYFF